MNSRKKYVIPGDVITTGPYRPEQNVALVDGKKIVSTAVGVTEIFDDSVRVIPLAGKYIPKINDLVVGMIVSHTSLSWELDINSHYVGFLPASDVFGRDFSAHADELATKLKRGDLVAARIANFDRTRDPLVTISDRDLGKIESGELVKMSPNKVPRLIGKRGSMIQVIESATNAVITIGMNGWIIVACDDTDGLLKAKKAIKMVDDMTLTLNLTEQVKEMLEQDNSTKTTTTTTTTATGTEDKVGTGILNDAEDLTKTTTTTTTATGTEDEVGTGILNDTVDLTKTTTTTTTATGTEDEE